MGIQANPYPLRLDQILMNKIKNTAEDNGRSVNKEIEFALKVYVAEFEKENGPIVIPSTPSE